MRRLFLLSIWLLLPLVSFAQSPAPSEPVATATTSAAMATITTATNAPILKSELTPAKPADKDLQKNLLRNFVGLMIVLGLLLLMVTLYKRTHLYKNFHEQPLRTVMTMALSPKQRLAVIELFGGYSLIAISEKEINLIQVLQPAQVIALEAYLAAKKPNLLSSRNKAADEVSPQDKAGFENLLKKILNNPGPQS